MSNVVKLCESVIKKEDQQMLQRKELLDALKILVLNHNACIHDELEKLTASPMEPENLNECANRCKNACPTCTNHMTDFALPIRKNSIKSFLCDVFIVSSSETIDGNFILKKLQTFPNVGIDVCGRKKSPQPPEKIPSHYHVAAHSCRVNHIKCVY